jgi:hypothetical protein
MFKGKGRALSEIIEIDHVLAIELLPDNGKITQRYIREVPLGLTRQHLADRHGFLLSVLNTLTEEEAVKLHVAQHAEIAGDLGHAHGDKPRSRREQAIADAEKEKASETAVEAHEPPSDEALADMTGDDELDEAVLQANAAAGESAVDPEEEGLF